MRIQGVFFTLFFLVVSCGVKSPTGTPQNLRPETFYSATSDVPTCATKWPGSSQNHSAAPLLGVRPAFEYSLMSTRYPMVVHAMNSTKVEYATRILAYADKSWEEIVERLGFRAPRADGANGMAFGQSVGQVSGDSRIDIYIRDDLMAGVGGYTGFTGFDDTTPEADAVGYLVIADLLTDVYIRGVVAHEFFHLSQMAYDWFEHPGFMEATAVWVTDHVFDDENFYSRYYAYYNKTPSQGLDHISLADPYQYGAGMWYQYFDETYGKGNGSAIRKLWEATVQPEMENTPDFFDGMRGIVGSDANLNMAFANFGLSRLLVGSRADGHHLREAELWSERVIPTFIELGDLTKSRSVAWSAPAGMQPYSHTFLRGLDIPDAAKLHFEFDAASSQNITVEEIRTSATERVVILTRSFDGIYDPETSVKAPVPVFGNIRYDVDK